jgi:hypothetical protein
LRKIADVAAKRVRRPLIKSGSVEAHIPANRLPDTDERADQR